MEHSPKILIHHSASRPSLCLSAPGSLLRIQNNKRVNDMGKCFAILIGWLGLISAASAQVAVPPELQNWREWVLHDHPDIRCPHLHNQAQKTCVWPSRLNLQLGDGGGQFDFAVETFAATWVVLPGADGYWPERVINRGETVTVVRRDGKPQVHLPIGVHQLSGVWSWQGLPRTLPIPAETGLLTLSLNGSPVANPMRAAAHELWLRGQREELVAPEGDSLEIKVFRHIEDANPALLETLVQLSVSGKEREVQTGPILLPGFQPRRFTSDLPARVERDGSLRVQLKPGRWEIRLRSHSTQPLGELTYQPSNDLWPGQEIWVFKAAPALRTVQLEGLPGIDPSQTQLPGNWQSLPAYLAESGNRLTIRELHRGDPNPVANQLSLTKDLWLDFTGGHFTVKDMINGSFTDSQRLEAVQEYVLGRAEQDGQPLSVTRLTEQGPRGVEIRSQRLNLLAVSRLERDALLPVSGWQASFDKVQANLHLPPGWSLFHATSADRVSGSWIGNWSLWEIFLVLIIAVALARATTSVIGALAFVTVVLVFQRPGSPLVIWLNFAAIFALLPFAKGKFLIWLRRYLWLSFAALLLILLPFTVQQARKALYPQLEKSWSHDVGIFNNTSEPAMYRVPDIVQSDAVEEVVVQGIRSSAYDASRPRVKVAPMQQKTYDPGQKIQVGPGVPDWRWHQVSLGWSGPVMAEEQARLYLVPPWLNRLGYVLAILLPLLLTAALLRHMRGRIPSPTVRIWPFNAAAAALLLAMGFNAPTVDAQVLMDEKLLKALEQRLVKAPECLPDCAAIESVSLTDEEHRLTLNMRVHSASDMAFPLPAQVSSWYPQSVTVNGRDAAWLKSIDGRLWVRLPQGHHQLQLQGSTSGREQVSLSFEVPLHNVKHTLKHWRVSGEPNAQQMSQVLQLQREQTQQASRDDTQKLLPDPIPPYVTVTRQIHVGLEWTVSTVVSRVAPAEGVINLSVPLLPGEGPNGGQVRNGAMDVRLGAQQRDFTWESTLKPFGELTLVAPENQPWAEIWSLDISPSWHSSVTGIPAVAGNYNTWQPWPGESISIAVVRPAAVEGRQLSIDAVELNQNVGKRADNLSLKLQMRATQGENYDLQLPENAQLQRVIIDGHETPVSQSQNRLKIPVNPGSHRIQVDWQSENDGGVRTETPSLDLGMPATNLRLHMNLPSDRWLLFVGGPSIGPALLFWGVLVVVLALAVGLARTGMTPLKAYEWVLLSLGVATFNLYVLALIAIWFVALHWRGRRQTEPNDHLFNLLQIGLFILSVVVLGAIVSAIPVSLLSRPEMMVAGNDSSATYLQWYQDHSGGILPTGWAITLPLWIYRVAMLIWALWLAFALMRWLPWAWRNLGVHGYWWTPVKPTKQEPESPPPAP